MKKQGLGIALNGRELRVAHLRTDGKHIHVLSLENARLPSFVETTVTDVESAVDAPPMGNPGAIDLQAAAAPDGTNDNVDVAAQLVLSLVEKYATKKIKVGLNLPTTDVGYQQVDDISFESPKSNSWFDKFSFRKKSEPPKKEFIISRKDGTHFKVVLETSTPFLLSLLEKQNAFLKGNLVFSVMLPGELALIQLCNRCQHVHDNDDISIILQVEDDFSHIIFMKGRELLSVTPFFTDQVGEGLNNILYSKIIYELDHWQIVEVSKILLASNAANEETIRFFKDKLPETHVDYIISSKADIGLVSDYTFEELSVYALPISLALRTLNKHEKICCATNMLPQEILDRQRVFKLSTSGIILLGVLGASTLTSTFVVMDKRHENGKLRRENAQYEMQLAANEPIVEKVQMLTEKIMQLAQVTTLADSLIEAYDQVLTFLRQANQTVAAANDVWINEIQNTENGFQIIGQSRDREVIPMLSTVLGKSILRRVYQEYESDPVYSFEIDLVWPSDPVFLPSPAGDKGMQLKMQRFPGDETAQHALTLRNAPANYDSLQANVENSALQEDDANNRRQIHNTKYYEMPKQAGDARTTLTIVLEKVDDLQTARDYLQQIQQSGYDVFLRRINDQYFICTEDFTNRRDAEEKLSRLKSKNITNAEIVAIEDFPDSEYVEPLVALPDADSLVSIPAVESSLAVVGDSDELDAAVLQFPDVDSISSDVPLGPPAPLTFNNDAADFESNDLLSAAEPPPEDWTTMPADSEIPAAHENYSENEYLDSAFISEDFSEPAYVESRNDSAPFPENNQASALEEAPVAENARPSTGSENEIISLRATDRVQKIVVLVDEHFFSQSAVEESLELQKHNIETMILDLRALGKIKPFWVCVGEFDSVADAERMIDVLKKRVVKNYKVKLLHSRDFMQYKKHSAPI